MRFLSLLFAALFVSASTQGQTIHRAKAPSPKAGTMFVYPERIALKNGTMFTAQRGQMFVPANRSKPGSDVISVEFYRFPSFNPETKAPPLFMLQGGPGFEGLEEELKKPGRFESQFMIFLNFVDIVVVGQRGIGSSKPNTVMNLSRKKRKRTQPPSLDERAAEFQKLLMREKQFWIDQGMDLSGLTVLEAASDVHDVCKGLGYEKMATLGGSFGSHWAMAIMHKYPDLVSHAVLSGLEGPDHTWDHPGWAWNVYKRVAKEAEADPKLAPLIPDGGLVKAAETLVKMAEEDPIRVVIDQRKSDVRTFTINADAMRRLVMGYSGSLKSWPHDIIQLHNGNYIDAARWLEKKYNGSQRDFDTASFWMLDSASGISKKKRAEYGSDPAIKIIGDANWRYALAQPICDIDVGDEFRLRFKTDVPTLMVHGTWDQSTPYENAKEVLPMFTNAKLVTVERGSHGALAEALGADQSFAWQLFQFILNGDFSKIPDRVELRKIRDWTVPK